MQVEGAVIREQGITFAVVVVKSHAERPCRSANHPRTDTGISGAGRIDGAIIERPTNILRPAGYCRVHGQCSAPCDSLATIHDQLIQIIREPSMATSKFGTVAWKRNLNQIPSAVKAKLAAPSKGRFLAGVVKTIPTTELRNGTFAHIGVGQVNGEFVFLDHVLPPAAMGRYSTRNREGWTVVHRDLPKVSETRYIETPNFGDWSRGSHTIALKREVFQRDYVDPPECKILVELLNQGETEAIFKFVVDIPLDPTESSFDEQLLFALNLLQENVGAADVLPADATTESLLSTLGLEWKIFPPGTADEVVRRVVAAMRSPSAEQQKLVRERVVMFNALRPQQFLQGQGGLNSYVGALFADDLVVFENVRYGNALYVLFEDWADVSKRSRIDLLRARNVKFERFVHSPGWQKRFEDFIRFEKRKRGLNEGQAPAQRRFLEV